MDLTLVTEILLNFTNLIFSDVEHRPLIMPGILFPLLVFTGSCQLRVHRFVYVITSQKVKCHKQKYQVCCLYASHALARLNLKCQNSSLIFVRVCCSLRGSLRDILSRTLFQCLLFMPQQEACWSRPLSARVTSPEKSKAFWFLSLSHFFFRKSHPSYIHT